MGVERHVRQLIASNCRPISKPLRPPCVLSRCIVRERKLFSTASSRLLVDETGHLPNIQISLDRYKESLSCPSLDVRSAESLTKSDVGKTVTLHGYLDHRRDVSGSLTFASLLNPANSHIIQLVSFAPTPEDFDRHSELKKIPRHSPISVTGHVRARKGTKMAKRQDDIVLITEVELELKSVLVLNEFPRDVMLEPETVYAPEQRHLQLRSSYALRHALALRSKVGHHLRNHLISYGFTEVETPILFKSTPEGAREFLVPTRRKAMAYALVQSPQQYKQTLMASGVHRYFQFAKCFRDEDLRADRQPEFTQLDLEMGFADEHSVMQTIESIIVSLWDTMLKTPLSAFPRLPYQESMSRYGSDKPDLRLGMEIHDVSQCLTGDKLKTLVPTDEDSVIEMLTFRPKAGKDASGLVPKLHEYPDDPSLPEVLSNVKISRCTEEDLFGLSHGETEHLRRKANIKTGDIVFLHSRKKAPHTGGSTAMGRLRLALHRTAVSLSLAQRPQGFAFLWVTDFPLFQPSTADEPGQGGSAGLSSTHHPFTAPKAARDVDALRTDPAAAVGAHYDLVVNGVELGGGSRRIHRADVQAIVFEKVLRMPEDKVRQFGHLLGVLRSGCPPHAGIALGFDRLIAVMMGLDSIRDVVAFPKNGRGEDPLVKSPSEMTPAQLQTYHLLIAK